jgi:hypothetical protein
MTDRAPILFTNHVMHGEYRSVISSEQGRIQDFKLGGAHLTKLRRAEGGAKIFGVFRMKNHDFKQNILFFSILGGGERRVRRPLDPPLVSYRR